MGVSSSWGVELLEVRLLALLGSLSLLCWSSEPASEEQKMVICYLTLYLFGDLFKSWSGENIFNWSMTDVITAVTLSERYNVGFPCINHGDMSSTVSSSSPEYPESFSESQHSMCLLISPIPLRFLWFPAREARKVAQLLFSLAFFELLQEVNSPEWLCSFGISELWKILKTHNVLMYKAKYIMYE